MLKPTLTKRRFLKLLGVTAATIPVVATCAITPSPPARVPFQEPPVPQVLVESSDLSIRYAKLFSEGVTELCKNKRSRLKFIRS